MLTHTHTHIYIYIHTHIHTYIYVVFIVFLVIPHSHKISVDTYLLTYLLTPWCRVLLQKLTGLQLVKKFPAFHGTRRFITALTSVRHLSLSWASPVQSIYPHPTSWRSIIILSTHLRLGLPSGLLPSGEISVDTFFYVLLTVHLSIFILLSASSWLITKIKKSVDTFSETPVGYTGLCTL